MVSPDKRLQCGLFGENPAEYLSFTMAISVSPRYPSHYLYSIHTCACDHIDSHASQLVVDRRSSGSQDTAARQLPEQAGGGTGGGRTGTETSIIWVPGSLIALG